MSWGDRAAEQHEQGLPAIPVIVVHLEDPPGSGRAACCGLLIEEPGQNDKTPRWFCTGCHRSVIPR